MKNTKNEFYNYNHIVIKNICHKIQAISKTNLKIIKIFLIFKLLTPLIDYGSKPTCPERVVKVQSTVKTRRVRLIQERQSMWEMLD